MEGILDRRDLLFYLDFVSDATGWLQIAEPTGFDGANFVVKQKSDGYARDVSFAGGEFPIDFDPLTTIYDSVNNIQLTHEFDKIISYYETYGFESEIRFRITERTPAGTTDIEIGELDFSDAETDGLKYFSCKIIQDAEQVKVKRREDVNVDLFSDTNIDGESITPLSTVGVLLKPLPTKQSSKWDGFGGYQFESSGDIFTVFFNPDPNITLSNIENTLSPALETANDLNDFAIIDAQNTLTNVEILITDFSYEMEGEVDTYVELGLRYYIGTEIPIDYSQTTIIYEQIFPNGGSISETGLEFTISDLSIERDEKLFIWFQFVKDPGYGKIDVSSMNTRVNAVSTSIASVTRSVRLVDAIKQVCLSIGSNGIDAPRFDVGGEFYDQYLFNGKLIRGIVDEPFNMSLKDLVGWFPEVDADYEVQEDGSVFFGIREDFYNDVEIGSFEMLPNSEYKETFNDRHLINKFEFAYNRYEKGDNGVEQNSLDSIHTEAQLHLPNLRANDTKDVNVDFVRDPFNIEKTRKQNIISEENASYIDDDTTFIIDVVQETTLFTETLVLNFLVQDITSLKVANDGSFNWTLTGMLPNDFIELTGQNAGTWRILGLEPTVLTLAAIGSSEATYSGFELVSISYTVSSTDLVNRTNQGFEYILNTADPTGFSNIVFSIKRNTTNYYGSYLHECCRYHRLDEIQVTKFINNGELTSRYAGEGIFVIEDFKIYVKDLKTRLLEPKVTHTEVLASFDEIKSLLEKSRTLRGYVSITNNNQVVKKVFPKMLDFDWKQNILTIDGEDKAIFI